MCYEKADGSNCSPTNPTSGKARYYYNWAQANARVPSGWYLPSRSQIDTLMVNYLSNVGTYKNPMAWCKYDVWDNNNSRLDAWGAGGNFWTSTNYSDTSAYGLYTENATSRASYSNKTRYGFTVRYIKNGN